MACGPEKRYGKALFELASEQKEMATLVKEADSIIEILQNEKNDFSPLINNPTLSNHQKSDIFSDFLKKAKSSDTMRKFVALMVQRGRGDILLESLAWFKDFYLESENIVKAKITTAFPIATKQKGEIEAFVKKKSSGSKKVELKEEVNEDLIGGFKILVGSQEFDASLSGSLNQIKANLK